MQCVNVVLAQIVKRFRPVEREHAGFGLQRGPGRAFLTTVWFGLLTGWLEIALVLADRAVSSHVSLDAVRTNHHFMWMIPVSDVLLFSFVGLAIAVVARLRRELASWTISRLPLCLSFLTLLLTIKGLYPIAGVTLACGLTSVIGSRLERCAAGFGRVMRLSFPVMAVSLIVLAAVKYERVISAEHRALALRPPAKPGVPNVLLIVLDTVRAASLSLYGHNRPTTPNLERLASKGILFTEARSTAPWTLPSHASMMTGRWPHELSVGWDLPLDGTHPTLAEALSAEGYATAGFVANTDYCSCRHGLSRGFSRYESFYENRNISLFETIRSSGLGKRVLQLLSYVSATYPGDAAVRKTAAMVNRNVLGWLAGRPADRPFFVFVNYFDAHRPYVFPDDAPPRFGLAALPAAKQVEIDKMFQDLVAEKYKPADITPEKIASARRVANDAFTLYADSYDSCIAYLDQQVGNLLDEMERLGSLENTLVIVTSDHGEQLGERGVLGHATSLYRREVHVPLLLIPPTRTTTAQTVHEPVSLREIPATVAEWVDLGQRNPFPGRSLTRFLSGGAEHFPEASPVLSEVEHRELPPSDNIPSSLGPITSLVSRDHVYIQNAIGREELYDLVHDPLDSVDLSRYPESGPVIDRFRDELSRLRRGTTRSGR